MAKRTLLDLVQTILSELDGDEVNSISDTIEATSVATVIRQVYYGLTDNMDLPHNGTLVALEGLGDSTKPTHMHIPDNVGQIEWIKYDNRTNTSGDKSYQDITYLSPQDFINLGQTRASTDTTQVQTVMYDSNIPILISLIAGPTYWTSFDDEYIVFDSINKDVDSTLQSSKCMCRANTRPTFTLSDTFIPDLPENLFELLYNKSLARCFGNQRQTLNPKIEREELRSTVRAQRNKWRQSRMIHTGPDYGRRRP